MSTLYRCRARVGYKLYRSDKVIVFDEKQIQDLSVKLKWNSTFAGANSQGGAAVEGFTSSVSKSTCQVVISDPYLTGLAWPALYDGASMWSYNTIAQANHITMPACKPNEDPFRDKCFNFASIDESGLVSSNGVTDLTTSLAHIIVSLWYEVNGTTFGTDYYFRVNRIAIGHGANYPVVTISGQDAKSITFNQNLVNLKFDEGLTVEDALKQIAETSGFTASFCKPKDGKEPERFTIPKTVIYKGITPDEGMKKLVASVGGSMLSLPIKEHANKISVCTRGDSTGACTVFYLGKGLYESYEIQGEIERTFQGTNSQAQAMISGGFAYKSEPFLAETYSINEVIKEKRIKAFEKANKVKIPSLFKPCTRCQGELSSGLGWRGPGPKVKHENLNQVNFYELAPNGKKAISYLSGKVESADGKSGVVTIKTEFWFNICKEDDSKKCFGKYIYQESRNLSEVKVKAQEQVDFNKEIGTSTDEKKELVRFYILGPDLRQVTIDPELIWNYAAPTETASEFNKDTPPAPTSTGAGQNPPPAPTSNGEGVYVGRVGSTGNSTGPHIHIQESTSRTLSEAQLFQLAGKYVTVNKRSLTSYPRGAGFGDNRNHKGIDFPIAQGEEIRVFGRVVAGGTGVGGGDCGNGVAFVPPEGPELLICHLQDETIPPNISGLSASGSAGKTTPAIANSPTSKALTIETSFKGVPRALRITPGRTILSFITDYDKWVEDGGPRGQADGVDPGIWIPDRFRNWFINEVEFAWRQGDLRVNIEALSGWGNSLISAPRFNEYLTGKQLQGEFERTNDYYGYIRSIGDLCFPVKSDKDGKYVDSCSTLCEEAQQFYRRWGEDSATSGGDGGGGGEGSFPASGCTTGDSTKDAIINALYSAGFKTPNAFAGALGNFQKESSLNFNIHNTANRGNGCSGTRSRILGSVGYGLAQWCGSRADDLASKYNCGRNCSLSQQLSFLVFELKSYSGMISRMNAAPTASQAAIIFRAEFERPGALDASDRAALAEQIVKQIKCNKP